MNTPSKQALRAAEAIINSVANPSLNYETRNCNALALARIIDEEFKELREACHKAQGALQRLGSIDDETRIGWALQALDTALASEHPVNER